MTSLVLASCQTTIPNVKVYKEIPFIDAPEAVFVESGTWREGLIGPEEWAKKRPLMIMIDPEGWKAIKDQWYEACRKAGAKCTSQVDSIVGLIKTLDSISSQIIPKP